MTNSIKKKKKKEQVSTDFSIQRQILLQKDKCWQLYYTVFKAYGNQEQILMYKNKLSGALSHVF